MDRSEKVILTNMCMVYDENGYVLVQDKVDKEYAGIMFPGGHVEQNESFTDAVIREVYEETGLTISAPEICGIKQWPLENGGRYVVLLYKTNNFKGEIRSSDEGQVYWVKMSELMNLNLAEGMDKMLQVFNNDEIGEYYFYKENEQWMEMLK